jgi:hypothetical protein
MISCDLQDLEELMRRAGVLLTGNEYDTAQDYLQERCSCDTYQWLLGYKIAREGDDVDTVSWSSSNPTGEVASND